jgi:hypothetical protein
MTIENGRIFFRRQINLPTNIQRDRRDAIRRTIGP